MHAVTHTTVTPSATLNSVTLDDDYNNFSAITLKRLCQWVWSCKDSGLLSLGDAIAMSALTIRLQRMQRETALFGSMNTIVFNALRAAEDAIAYALSLQDYAEVAQLHRAVAVMKRHHSC